MNNLAYSRCAIGKGHARVDDELRVVKVEFLHCLAVATASLYGVVDVFRTIKERYAPPTKTNKVLGHKERVVAIVHHHLRHILHAMWQTVVKHNGQTLGNKTFVDRVY